MAKEIRQLPIAPDSANPATFNERADKFVAALAGFVTDANALAKELEEFSANVSQKNEDANTKYNDLVAKYNDFITKYADFFAKYDIFVPAYLDVKTKHGETVSTAKAHKEYVDTLKAQIDEALERAKSFINEQNKVIDDSKVAETSTFSSTELVRRFNLKADDATAYREWNYKEISDDYTAQNNDALFISATKPIAITLPSDGKIKVVDKQGSFSKFNAKLVAGSDTFILNRDFQRVELFKFSDKWQVVSGSIVVERNEFAVGKKLFAKSQLAPTKGISTAFVVGNLFFGFSASVAIQGASTTPVVIDLDTMTNILPSVPSIPSNMQMMATKINDDLFCFGYNHSNITEARLFRFDRGLRAFAQINLNSLVAILQNSSFGGFECTGLGAYDKINNNLYVYYRKGGEYYDSLKLVEIKPDGSSKEVYSWTSSSDSAAINDGILFLFRSNDQRIREVINLKTGAKITNLQNLKVAHITTPNQDFVEEKMYISLDQSSHPNQIIEWRYGETPALVTKAPGSLPTGNIYYPKIILSKQNGEITAGANSGSIILAYDAYENNRRTRKIDELKTINFNATKGIPYYKKYGKEFYCDVSSFAVLEISYTPTVFQEEK